MFPLAFISSPLGAARPLPCCSRIYLARTHLLLLIDLMRSLRAPFVNPSSSHPSPSPVPARRGRASPCGASLGLPGQLTRFHHWTKVRDPSSTRLSSLLHLVVAWTLSVPTSGRCAVTRHACAGAAGFATGRQTVVLLLKAYRVRGLPLFSASSHFFTTTDGKQNFTYKNVN